MSVAGAAGLARAVSIAFLSPASVDWSGRITCGWSPKPRTFTVCFGQQFLEAAGWAARTLLLLGRIGFGGQHSLGELGAGELAGPVEGLLHLRVATGEQVLVGAVGGAAERRDGGVQCGGRATPRDVVGGLLGLRPRAGAFGALGDVGDDVPQRPDGLRFRLALRVALDRIGRRSDLVVPLPQALGQVLDLPPGVRLLDRHRGERLKLVEVLPQDRQPRRLAAERAAARLRGQVAERVGPAEPLEPAWTAGRSGPSTRSGRASARACRWSCRYA